jgi:hypothetical protein
MLSTEQIKTEIVKMRSLTGIERYRITDKCNQNIKEQKAARYPHSTVNYQNKCLTQCCNQYFSRKANIRGAGGGGGGGRPPPPPTADPPNLNI